MQLCPWILISLRSTFAWFPLQFLAKRKQKNPQTKQESLAMIHVCQIPTAQFFYFVFKNLRIQTPELDDWCWKSSSQRPHWCSSQAVPVWQVPSFIPCLYWSLPVCKAFSPHESLLSQSHLSRIQIPKIDVNTVNSPLSLGILSKLWINWGTDLALGRVTLSSVAEEQHCLAISCSGQLWFKISKCTGKHYQQSLWIQLKLSQTF